MSRTVRRSAIFWLFLAMVVFAHACGGSSGTKSSGGNRPFADDDAADDDDDDNDDDNDDAAADDDDDNDDNDDATDDDMVDDAAAERFSLTAKANGDSPPVSFQPGVEYAFAFDAFNIAGGTESIKKVDVTMPTSKYVVDASHLAAPSALRPDRGAWTVQYAAETVTITWLFQNPETAAEVGDIAVGENLVFPFGATTDACGSDGFHWTIYGDRGSTVGDVFDFGGDDDATPATSACCVSGSCSMLSAAECCSAGGTWYSGWTCWQDPCGAGACCTAGGTCQEQAANAHCVNGGGTWLSGQTCSPYPCPVWTDASTHQLWQMTPPAEKYSWLGALTYCKSLNLGGRTGWHLPNVDVYRSLIRGCLNTQIGGYCTTGEQCLSCFKTLCEGCPALQGPVNGCYWPAQFGGACAGWRWLSDTAPGNKKKYAFIGDFEVGGLSSDLKTNSNYVRCVHGGSAIDDDATPPEVWTDTGAGLMWQTTAPTSQFNWADAQTYCANITLGGYSGWRLPDIDALRTLSDCNYTMTGGACNVTDSCLNVSCDNIASCEGCQPGVNSCYWPDQLNGTCGAYWSASEAAGLNSTAWIAYFVSGMVSYQSETSGLYVRCVRP